MKKKVTRTTLRKALLVDPVDVCLDNLGCSIGVPKTIQSKDARIAYSGDLLYLDHADSLAKIKKAHKKAQQALAKEYDTALRALNSLEDVTDWAFAQYKKWEKDTNA